MSEQPKIRISSDPNKPGHRQVQAALDRVISEDLDELNAMQADAGLPLLEDPSGADAEGEQNP